MSQEKILTTELHKKMLVTGIPSLPVLKTKPSGAEGEEEMEHGVLRHPLVVDQQI